jgi:hypothetical protein
VLPRQGVMSSHRAVFVFVCFRRVHSLWRGALPGAGGRALIEEVSKPK